MLHNKGTMLHHKGTMLHNKGTMLHHKGTMLHHKGTMLHNIKGQFILEILAKRKNAVTTQIYNYTSHTSYANTGGPPGQCCTLHNKGTVYLRNLGLKKRVQSRLSYITLRVGTGWTLVAPFLPIKEHKHEMFWIFLLKSDLWGPRQDFKTFRTGFLFWPWEFDVFAIFSLTEQTRSFLKWNVQIFRKK